MADMLSKYDVLSRHIPFDGPPELQTRDEVKLELVSLLVVAFLEAYTDNFDDDHEGVEILLKDAAMWLKLYAKNKELFKEHKLSLI